VHLCRQMLTVLPTTSCDTHMMNSTGPLPPLASFWHLATSTSGSLSRLAFELLKVTVCASPKSRTADHVRVCPRERASQVRSDTRHRAGGAPKSGEVTHARG
jgi:hypothetical protein